MPESDSQVQALAGLLDECARAVVFTGAGISTEFGDSGLSKSRWDLVPHHADLLPGLRRFRGGAPGSVASKLEINRDMVAAEPNRGHRAVAELVRTGKVGCVITQNIDGLHQASGIADDQIIELHGNGTYAHCLSCRERYELAPIKARIRARRDPSGVQALRRHRQDRDDLVRAGDAGRGDATIRGGDPRL